MEKQTNGKPRINDRMAAIVKRLTENAAGIQYGTVAVALRIHDGRVVDVTHTTTESTKETIRKTDER